MSAHLAPPPPTTATRQAEDALYYRAILHELIDMGADIARIVHQQAQAQPEPTTPTAAAPDPTIPFDRIARAIRRTILLAGKLAEPIAAQTPAPNPAQHRTAARARIIREVEDAIQRTTRDADAGALHDELLDRLDAPDLDDDIEHHHPADIIAGICRDLGIAAPPGTHPWKRRTPDDVRALYRQAATPRSPIPTPLPPANDPPSLARGSAPNPAKGQSSS